MKPRTPTDNSKALAHVLRNRPGLIINSSGHVLVCNSSTADPVCQKPPSDSGVNAMIRDDTIKHPEQKEDCARSHRRPDTDQAHQQ
jgi:hypothetical protein